MEHLDDQLILDLFQSGLNDSQISQHLLQQNPTLRGLSAASVKRWRLKKNIKRCEPILDDAVVKLVRGSVNQLGEQAGRRFVKGYITSQGGPNVSEKRIGAALRTIFPISHARRLNGQIRQTNPTPYRASYFGHKLHMDQNEKLANFGVTHVVAVDGYSGFIVADATMPIKNNVIIYDNVFKVAMIKYGMWDQIVVDHGQEFNLTLSVQNYLQSYKSNTAIAPYIQIPSTQNNRVERVWVEANSRVNFPLKAAIEEMIDMGTISRFNPDHMYCISIATLPVASVDMSRLFDARNHRHARRRGIPYDLMMENFGAASISRHLVPDGYIAASQYCNNGGHLTFPHDYGTDPLQSNLLLTSNRDQEISTYSFTPSEMYNFVANGHYRIFQEYIRFIMRASGFDVNKIVSGDLSLSLNLWKNQKLFI